LQVFKKAVLTLSG